MKSLKEFILEAEKKKVAIGHFNVSDLVGLKAVFEAARELQLPVIIGVSEGEREFIGVKQAALLVKSLREEYNFPIFINADHTKSLEKIKQAVEAGFDAIMFDASGLPLKENIKKTKEVVEYVKNASAGPQTKILVEAELGAIKGSSIILSTSDVDNIKEGDLAKPEEAAQFIKETGIDFLAAAVGNIHGVIAAGNPKLDIERIKKIKSVSSAPLVLHGGSGIKKEEFLKAIDAGISIIHINTELRLAWRKGMEKIFQEKPEEIIPYKILPFAVEEIKKVVYNRLKLFNKINE
ncbi:tagatose-bisphosphate aldolase [Candidatus Wolfebacteria bacterium CG03_land_8_20_14_0_80_40_12]|uniref:Tagatose-bisphosphate aldolase n=1 Tax=Candidatus Wolfebacteria bacterium CG03_land_8_20_14_0_80_40_12 TaxID=1975069 RepID=A0A2M7B5U1_9BACT|nr:MAG: tagatose-bisphosphate aldolase [Candidatus Wolfebacteria bacterium CG03_land_8_20_14_0_80_40_12]